MAASPSEPPSPKGLFDALRRLTASALELAEVRLQLLGSEIEAQKLRAVDALLWMVAALMLGTVGLALAVAFVLWLVQPPYRPAVLGVLALACLAGAAWAARAARRRLHTPEGPFAASLGELARDRAAGTAPPAGDAPPQ